MATPEKVDLAIVGAGEFIVWPDHLADNSNTESQDGTVSW